MTLTIEQFQKNAKTWLDKMKETGETLVLLAGPEAYEVRSAGPITTGAAIRDLDAIPKTCSIIGDPEDLVHIDWSSEWRP